MSKLNIIQRRELDPIMLKADKIVKHYEKASNCCALAIGPDMELDFDSICSDCDEKKKCIYLHMEAVNKAKQLGGSYIYLCQKGLVFWTSPFYSGERFAGALFSGGVKKTEKNNEKVKSLAQIMLLCANQISGMSFNQKNAVNLTIKNRMTENQYYGNAVPVCLTDNIHNDCQMKYPAAKKTSNGHEYKMISACENESFTLSIDHQSDSVTNESSPLDMERMLLASLRRGDGAEGQKILVKLLRILYLEVSDNFIAVHRMAAFRLKALELAVLLSRAVANPKDIMNDSALETTNHCLKKIEECSSFEEIKNILCAITERMSGMIFSFHGVRHFSALRKAERFIWQNYTRKLSLKEIAEASGLSAPYFSTVFKEEMGENLSNYLNKLRIEKAATMLITTNIPISEIAISCGFEDQSWFSKIFRNNTGFTPGKFREHGITNEGNIFN